MTVKRTQDDLDGLDTRDVTLAPQALAWLTEPAGPLPDAPTDSAGSIKMVLR